MLKVVCDPLVYIGHRRCQPHRQRIRRAAGTNLGEVLHQGSMGGNRTV
jgi:hypothetical protein